MRARRRQLTPLDYVMPAGNPPATAIPNVPNAESKTLPTCATASKGPTGVQSKIPKVCRHPHRPAQSALPIRHSRLQRLLNHIAPPAMPHATARIPAHDHHRTYRSPRRCDPVATGCHRRDDRLQQRPPRSGRREQHRRLLERRPAHHGTDPRRTPRTSKSPGPKAGTNCPRTAKRRSSASPSPTSNTPKHRSPIGNPKNTPSFCPQSPA